MTAGDTYRDEILVVDDTPASLKLLEEILSGAGYRVRLATDGELALRSVRVQPPALILLDVRMPSIDGYEVCRRLKKDEKTRSIPIIFLSILENEQEKIKAFQVGGVDYINKPFRAAEVLARVRNHIALRHAQLDLEARNGELEVARDTLEQRVKERSAELEQLNGKLQEQVDSHLRTLEALRQANKELEAFSYTVSHDLRAPLRAVHGFAQLLQEEYAPSLPSEAAHFVMMIQDNAIRMGHLVDNLLTFIRLGRLPLSLCYIAPEQLINPLVEQMQAEVMGQRHVLVSIKPLFQCHADAGLLTQAFANLLSNAFKYTRSRDPAMIEIGSLPGQSEGEVIYYVKDNGVGFDMQYAHKLFGIFERLHVVDEFEGTGVGLAITKRIITRHGGRIWAEGKVDAGATFYFSLPCREAVPEEG